MTLTLAVSAVLFLAFPFLASGASCGTTTLDAYIALGATGCTVDGFTFGGFSFGVISSSGGAAAVAANDVLVTPIVTNDELGLTFSSNGFSVSAGQKIQYLLAYTAGDPPIIHGARAAMTTDPPVFPGIASITDEECLGAQFSGSICPSSTASETVFSNGITSMLDSEQFFPPTGLIGDMTTITLDASSGGSAEFLSLSETVLTPEPRSALLMAAGAAILFWPGVRRLQFALKPR